MGKIDALLKNKNYRRKFGRLIFAKPYDEFKGELPKHPSAMRERPYPKLYDYSFIMTATAKKTFERMLVLIPKNSPPLKILDLGCGYKPFQLICPRGQYLGVDMSLNSYADVIADNHNYHLR